MARNREWAALLSAIGHEPYVLTPMRYASHFTLHGYRERRWQDFFNILLVALPRYQMDRTRLDRGHDWHAG